MWRSVSDAVGNSRLRTPAAEQLPSYTTRDKAAWLTLRAPDHMNATHVAGSTLQGDAHLRLKKDTIVTAVVVQFRCMTKTLVSDGGMRPVVSWEGLMFSQTIPLVRAGRMGVKLAAGDHAYPFVFSIPEVTPSAPPEVMEILPCEPDFETGSGQELPPSFTAHRCNARITYYLEIVAIHRDKPSRNIYDKMPIKVCVAPFQSTPLCQRPDNQMVEHKRYFGGRVRGFDSYTRPLARTSILSKMCRLVCPPSPFVISFKLCASIASFLSADGPIPLHLSSCYDWWGSNAPYPPDVRLLRVHVCLYHITELRAPRMSYGPAYMQRKQRHDVVKTKLVDRPILPWACEEPLYLPDIMPNLRLPLDIKPSFSSWLIRLWYHLRVVVVVEVAGKRFEVVAVEEPCEIGPRIIQAPSISSAGSGEPVPCRPPPPYQASHQPVKEFPHGQ